MKELSEDTHTEVRIRGQIMAISLQLEDTLTKLIYHTFVPENRSREILNLYLEQFILPISFGKKIDYVNKLLKTDIYQQKIIKYLENKPSLIELRNILSPKDLTDYLNKNLLEILKTRNLIAHGKNLNYLNISEINKKKGNILFVNHLKHEIMNKKLLEDFSKKTLQTAFIILEISSAGK